MAGLEEERSMIDARKVDVLLFSCAVPAMMEPEYVSNPAVFSLSLPRRCVQMIRSNKEISFEKVDGKSLYWGV